jgi:hypothetical protein
MLPPVEDAVLQNNPEFASLYNTLTGAILNPNGSTKNDPAAKEREAVRQVSSQHYTTYDIIGKANMALGAQIAPFESSKATYPHHGHRNSRPSIRDPAAAATQVFSVKPAAPAGAPRPPRPPTTLPHSLATPRPRLDNPPPHQSPLLAAPRAPPLLGIPRLHTARHLRLRARPHRPAQH